MTRLRHRRIVAAAAALCCMPHKASAQCPELRTCQDCTCFHDTICQDCSSTWPGWTQVAPVKDDPISCCETAECTRECPTASPSLHPSSSPTWSPTTAPTAAPTEGPSETPSVSPSWAPSPSPTFSPTSAPTARPTTTPSTQPTAAPSVSSPSVSPTVPPTRPPTTFHPTHDPSRDPTVSPTRGPTLPSFSALAAAEFVSATAKWEDTDKLLTGLGAVAGGTSAASRLATAGLGCGWLWDGDSLPFSLSPTGLVVAGSPTLGALIGNVLVIAGASALALVLPVLTERLPDPPEKLSNVLRLPSYLRQPTAAFFFFFEWMYAGITLCAARLLMHAPQLLWKVIGGVGVAVCIVIPPAIARQVSRAVPTRARYREDDQIPASLVTRWILGPGEWVARRPPPEFDKAWFTRHKPSMKTYEQSCVSRCACAQYVAPFLLSVAHAPQLDTWVHCGHLHLLSAVTMGASAIFFIRAHNRPYYNTLVPLELGAQSAGLSMLAASLYRKRADGRPDTNLLGSADPFFLVAALAVFARTGLNMSRRVLTDCGGRRRRMQGEEYREYLEAEDKARALEDEVTEVDRSTMSAPGLDDGGRAPSLLSHSHSTVAFRSSLLQHPLLGNRSPADDGLPGSPSRQARYRIAHTRADGEVGTPRLSNRHASYGGGFTKTPVSRNQQHRNSHFALTRVETLASEVGLGPRVGSRLEPGPGMEVPLGPRMSSARLEAAETPRQGATLL
eukprot:TRINITY_DN17968_c1_g2_i1.p1 TRINITY_DN17968_c1_g2~~TRINITY_DN17968_c1_g2_i1.p1  ORF type:complete len:730 (+),score=104.46 TRINITY_DN17968_c1_g2_i1:84-2273(+)